ncbi:MAG: carboxylesterase/lipase family protein [Myxococcales bacterium]|nr:carboxylesterase/lipase family protein [Myxococcales bacterium]
MTRLVVETRAGTVRGELRPGPDPALPPVSIWKGIPYAEPPVGELRFAPPRPPRPWTGERDATRFGAVAVQSRDPAIAMMSGVTEKIASGEDCLTLNVFSPGADGERRPVVVWIHGGAFIMGSGSTPLYHGTSFASRHDLVVVTLNYRLGLLGLLYLGDLAPGHEEGNYALLDQIAALTWVRDNIEAFGGDPGQVTIMGESAGAVSIGMLLAMPAARGLFHRAILQSGAAGLSPPSRDDATRAARGVLAELGATVAQLAEVPVDRLLEVQARMGREGGLIAFSPYIDGVTIPRSPLDVMREATTAEIPLLLGSNRDEWTLFELFMGERTVTPFKPVLRDHLGEATIERMFALYREERPGRTDAQAWIELIGDVAFRIPLIRLAEARSAHQRGVFMYRFDWASPAFGNRLGAAHALELPFVWNRLDLPLAQVLLAEDVGPAQPLATQLHATWAAFIKSGDPNGAGLPAWPAYDLPRRATMILDRACTVVDDPGGATRAMWSL